MGNKKTLLLALSFLVSLTLSAQVYNKRLALVIGNSSYQHGGALKNPVNDARAMSSALQNMGFEVLRHENITQNEMKKAINDFGVKLRGYEVGLFYYAGHGIQYKGGNYLIPVEADLQAEEQVEFDCVAADRVLAYMESASTKVNILIMDACRNNPFERSWHRSANGNGLAMMNAPTGTLIAYATAPGKVASDGETANGLYTSMLLKFMKDPSLTLEQVFKKVRTEVTEKSSGAQVPWETTSLTGGDFYLTKKEAAATETSRSNLGDPSNALPSSGEDHELSLQFYNAAQDLYDKYQYSAAIENYTKAIQYNPLDYQAYLWRGHSKYNLGYEGVVKDPKMLEASIEDYSKAIQLSPYEAEAYYYRANAKKLLKRFAEAIPDFTLSLRYDPSRVDSYYYRGLTYYSLQQYAAGLEDFSKLLELEPRNASAYYWRGGCKYGLTKYEESLLDFDKSLEIDPTRTDAILFKADAYYGMGDYDNSIKYYNEVIKVLPNSIDAIMYLAHSYFNLGNYQTALDEYEHCVKIDPNYSDALYWRSRVYKFGLKDDSKARAEIKKALAIEPSNPTYTSYYEEYFK